MIGHLNQIISLWYKEDVTVVEALKKIKREIASSKINEVGWDYPNGESYLQSQKRTLVIAAAGKSGDVSVITEMKARFKRLMDGEDSAIPADLLSSCLSIAIRNSDSPMEDFDKLLDFFKNQTSQERKLTVITAMGATNSRNIIDLILTEIIWNKEIVRDQDLFYCLSGLNDNPDLLFVRPKLWSWFKENFTTLASKFENSMGLFGHVVANCAGSSNGWDHIDEVESWVRGDDCKSDLEKKARILALKSVKTKVDQTLEKMKALTKWLERDRVFVAEWLNFD